MTTPANDPQHVTDRLAAPFEASEVKWKPAVVSGNRAMALAYVDARVIQDRLDDVLGVTGWQDEYECLPDGSVVCRLRLRLGEEWITKMDVGGQSEQPDEGDRRKAAFSDALKRAAVKFGIGRYLYRLPAQWVDYDPRKKQFVRMPTLPPEALPGGRAAAPAPQPPAAPAAKLPLGERFALRITNHEAELVKAGRCRPGELQAYLIDKAQQAKGKAPLPFPKWNAAGIATAGQWVKAFEAAHAAPDGAPILQEEILDLDGLLKQARRKPADAMRSLGLPPSTRLDALTRGHYEQLRKALLEEIQGQARVGERL